MALRTIRLEGDEILRKTSRPVTEITDKILTLLDDMAETMYENNGVGLAAPQVGVLRRVVVIDMRDAEDNEDGENTGGGYGLIELINPEIVSSEGSQINFEGCLSLPGEKGAVERPDKMVVKALDRHGVEQIYELEDYSCVVFSHEIDHLEGVLYMDKIIEGYEEAEDEADE